jgi:hypothetical protein
MWKPRSAFVLIPSVLILLSFTSAWTKETVSLSGARNDLTIDKSARHRAGKNVALRGSVKGMLACVKSGVVATTLQSPSYKKELFPHSAKSVGSRQLLSAPPNLSSRSFCFRAHYGVIPGEEKH